MDPIPSHPSIPSRDSFECSELFYARPTWTKQPSTVLNKDKDRYKKTKTKTRTKRQKGKKTKRQKDKTTKRQKDKKTKRQPLGLSERRKEWGKTATKIVHSRWSISRLPYQSTLFFRCDSISSTYPCKSVGQKHFQIFTQFCFQNIFQPKYLSAKTNELETIYQMFGCQAFT